MKEYVLKAIPNLKPFNYTQHYRSLFINQEWVLVNGISKKKSMYTFRDDHFLEISRLHDTIVTSWDLDIHNVFSIETEDGLITVKAYFKDQDVLVLSHQNKMDFALFINTSSYDNDINSTEDIQMFLKAKYKQKVTDLIYGHEFFYIENSEEFGPFTVEELSEKINNDDISAYCFVRDINEADYSKRLRIHDLIKELQRL